MVDIPIVDTHLHVWDPSRLTYPWLSDVPVLHKPFVLEDYRAACADVKVEKMVFLQCEVDFAQYQQEADWVTSLAAEDPRIEGIVPWAPLEQGEAARPALERLAENRLVKGIRRIIQFEPDVTFCLQPDFVKGVQMLSDFNLSFDICIAHHQMEHAIQLVQQCPQVKFVLDHIGKPDIKGQVLEPWRSHIKQLAELPHVYCKVSGLVVEADMEHWQPTDLRPYLSHVFESFGFDRVLFGGDWPVVIQAAPLERWIETLWSEVAGCSTSEKQKLFYDNGVAFYRLKQ